MSEHQSKLKSFSTIDLVESLSIAMDLVSSSLVNHHRRVAYISWQLANELELPEQKTRDLVIAAMLHDCGALPLERQVLTLQFDTAEVAGLSVTDHAESGYQLLKKFSSFGEVARIVRYHHHSWNENGTVPQRSSILHLADRLDVLARKCSRTDILSHRENIVTEIRRKSGTLFMPDLVTALEKLFARESFWLDIVNMSLHTSLGSYVGLASEQLDCDSVLEMTEIFSQVVDFRSKHTAFHTSMVSAVSGALARLMGFSEADCLMIKIAGNLHDLGKLAVPPEILDKPGSLTGQERSIIRTHPYYTHKILCRFRELGQLRCWASYHHERVDGTGYPFHLAGKELDSGSRIVAVADIYTALREDRPYRVSMSVRDTLDILHKMQGSALDEDVVDLVARNQEELEHVFAVVQKQSRREFQRLQPFIHGEG